MPRVAIRPSRAVAEFLRTRRQKLGLTLRDVERQTRASGRPVPFTTLAKIERGVVDPGLARLQALLDVYRLPIQSAGDLLDIERLAGEVPTERDPRLLLDRAADAWRLGDVPTALAHYLAVHLLAVEGEADKALRHESVLSFSVAAAKLGKHHIARQVLEELLLDRPAPEHLPNVLTQLASSWQALGSPDAALAFLGRAAEVTDPRNWRIRGWVAHLRGSIEIEARNYDVALSHLFEASRCFVKARRPYDRALVLVATARLEVERGDAPGALRAARRAVAFAKRHALARVLALARIQEARSLLLAGDPSASIPLLAKILGDALARTDNVIRFYAHYYLWKAYTDLGSGERASVELSQAKFFVRFIDQATTEASEVRGHLTDA